MRKINPFCELFKSFRTHCPSCCPCPGLRDRRGRRVSRVLRGRRVSRVSRQKIFLPPFLFLRCGL